jgi:hypothetical protein
MFTNINACTAVQELSSSDCSRLCPTYLSFPRSAGDGAMSFIDRESISSRTFRSARTARNRLPTLDPIRLANPILRLLGPERPELLTLTSDITSGEMSSPVAVLILPQFSRNGSASRGTTELPSCPPTTLVGVAYFLLDVKLVLMFVGKGVPEAAVTLDLLGIALWPVYSREMLVKSLDVRRYAPSSVIARLTGRTLGLSSASSLVPSYDPGSRRLRMTVEARLSR